jgi:predicted Fe-Mo cluster-binding NifX family protein
MRVAFFVRMKVAVCTFRGRVSPRFDTCVLLTIFHVERGRIVRIEGCPTESGIQKFVEIRSSEIDLLICGWIDDLSRVTLENLGVQVISNMVGEIGKSVQDLLVDETSTSLLHK